MNIVILISFADAVYWCCSSRTDDITDIKRCGMVNYLDNLSCT